MGYYSGRLIVKLETNGYKQQKEHGLIASLQFSTSFNKNKLYLNNTILNQILDSGAVQDYIIDECSKYFKEYEKEVNDTIRRIITKDHNVRVEIKLIGKFFYIKFYCSRDRTIEDCIKALTKKLKKEKDKIDILRGE